MYKINIWSYIVEDFNIVCKASFVFLCAFWIAFHQIVGSRMVNPSVAVAIWPIYYSCWVIIYIKRRRLELSCTAGQFENHSPRKGPCQFRLSHCLLQCEVAVICGWTCYSAGRGQLAGLVSFVLAHDQGNTELIVWKASMDWLPPHNGLAVWMCHCGRSRSPSVSGFHLKGQDKVWVSACPRLLQAVYLLHNV